MERVTGYRDLFFQERDPTPSPASTLPTSASNRCGGGWTTGDCRR